MVEYLGKWRNKCGKLKWSYVELMGGWDFEFEFGRQKGFKNSIFV